MTSEAITEFITHARAVSFIRACEVLGVPLPGATPQKKGQKKSASRTEYQGPCPRCGGDDRFSVNRLKGAWNCRGCGQGGRDALSLVAHYRHLDLHRRAEFLEACSILLGEPVPAGGERETDEERAARALRIAETERLAEQRRVEEAADANVFREREIRQARGLWLNAQDCLDILPDAVEGRAMARAYFQARTQFRLPDGVFEHLRFRRGAGYYHGQDALGRPMQIYAGPSLILPIVRPGVDGMSGEIIGCHQTWIEIGNPAGKFRPVLWALTKDGRVAGLPVLEDGGHTAPPAPEDIEAGFYERLPTKKMRGSKKGGLLPVCGGPELSRWVVSEGAENVVAFAGAEEWRADTFYCTGGDLGNLAGPRDPSSDFDHPTLRKVDAKGRFRAVRVPGPVPKADQDPDEAMPVLPHVRELVLVADGDSEPVWTAAAMARAEARLSAAGREIFTLWPPAGTDLSGAISAALHKGEAI
jgi:hypothetical protein